VKNVLINKEYLSVSFTKQPKLTIEVVTGRLLKRSVPNPCVGKKSHEEHKGDDSQTGLNGVELVSQRYRHIVARKPGTKQTNPGRDNAYFLESEKTVA